ncbi:hypothetical protein M0657_012196 [Pyricularia oryzae]|nr:hypothetical protein M0657_012196 [Pyricularia oryzae]
MPGQTAPCVDAAALVPVLAMQASAHLVVGRVEQRISGLVVAGDRLGRYPGVGLAQQLAWGKGVARNCSWAPLTQVNSSTLPGTLATFPKSPTSQHPIPFNVRYISTGQPPNATPFCYDKTCKSETLLGIQYSGYYLLSLSASIAVFDRVQ